jgi:hypothetical protein
VRGGGARRSFRLRRLQVVEQAGDLLEDLLRLVRVVLAHRFREVAAIDCIQEVVLALDE